MAKQRTQSTHPKLQQGNAGWFEKLPSSRKDLVCLVALYIVLILLFREIIFTNSIFSATADVAAHNAWVKAIDHIRATESMEPLWVPYLFSGMPVFGALLFPRNVNYVQHLIVEPLSRVLFFGVDVSWLIIPFLVMGVGMYLLARQLKFSQLPALIAALTAALNPYAVGLPETGHGSKLIVLGYIPLLFLLTHSLFTKRNFLSFGLLTVTIATMLLSAHPQIAFYGLLLVGCYFLYEIVLTVREAPKQAVLVSLLFIAAIGVGFMSYAYQYFPSAEYAKYSIRGGGGTPGASTGLAYDYATNWSFHPFEIMNFLIPSFFGLKFFGDKIDAYWGWMPFTNSAVYVGLIPVFLGALALAYRRNRMTIFLAIMAVIFLLISFGRYFGILFNPMFYYLPYFNKFRTPVMILHLMPVLAGLLAAYGIGFLQELSGPGRDADAIRLRKKLLIVLAVVGGIFLIGLVAGDALYGVLSGFMFEKPGEMQMLQGRYGMRASDALSQFKHIRFETFWQGYTYFAILTGVIVGLVIAYLRRSIRFPALAGGLTVLLVIDLMVFDGKYINPQPNTPEPEAAAVDPAIRQIQDEAKNSLFRVLPVRLPTEDSNMLMENLIPSALGYSPAKIQIYQEMIDSTGIDRPANQAVISMLNVKYLTGQQQTQDGSVRTIVQPNPAWLPRAWFVDSTVVTRSKAEIFGIMNSATWNPKVTALLEKEPGQQVGKAGSGTVSFSKYQSRDFVMNVTAPVTGLLVVSEVYYPAGWKATIDGNEAEILKTNYVLRSLVIPAGAHTVEFTFDPPMYNLGFTITEVGWGIMVIIIVIGMLQLPAVKGRLFRKTPAGTVQES